MLWLFHRLKEMGLIHVADMLKILLLKIAIQNALKDYSEGNSIIISLFLGLTLDIIKMNGVVDFSVIKSKLLSELQNSYGISDNFPEEIELTSKCLLSITDNTMTLDLRMNDKDKLYRQASKLLSMPTTINFKSNNVSLSESQSFEVSFQGMDKDKVLSNLVTILHNAYVRSFFFPGALDQANYTTLNFLTTKGAYLSLYNIPELPKGDIVVDVRFLTPVISYKLHQWLELNGEHRIIFLGTRQNISSLTYQVFTGFSTEAYLILPLVSAVDDKESR